MVWLVLAGMIIFLLLRPSSEEGERLWEARDEIPLEWRQEMEMKLRLYEWMEKRAAEIEELSPVDERRGTNQ